MRKIYFIAFALCFFGGMLLGQENGTVEKRTVEKNRRPNNKVGYNAMLLDALKQSDAAYSDFETIVQKVWDQTSSGGITEAAVVARSAVDKCRNKVSSTPVYVGGDTYQVAVLDYIDAVKEKIAALEKYGLLGADPSSDFELYNGASLAFNEISNQAIIKRDVVREQKVIYEKTFYIEK